MNELLLVLTVVVCVMFVLAGWKFGKERLYSVIIVFLILIATVGGKIVPFFGHETNTGNIFYASVFLATYFLIERYGRREGIYSIWVGVIWVIFFSILFHISVALVGSESTALLNSALDVAFGPVTRLAFASLVAYGVSQTINVYLYLYLKDRMHRKRLWLRANISNAVAQVVDSLVFFSFAFGGVFAPINIFDVIMAGLALKIGFMMIAAPLLYLNTIQEEEDEQGDATITLHP